MLEILQRFFGKNPAPCSKDIAKDRLKLVLVHNRSGIPPEIIEKIKKDIMAVLAHYAENETDIEVQVASQQGSVAMMANIPVKGPKK